MTAQTKPTIKELEFTKDICIATASTRKAKKWNNKTIPITEFVQQLSETQRTSETYDEYMSMSKAEQDDIKDVGGFVGGMLKLGKRTKHNVANRQLLVFDADFADQHFLKRVHTILKEYSHTIYSTHKHCEAKPRYRLIVYPNTPLFGDQYQACVRMLASRINIEYFDKTSWDLNRLMYWPSSASDADVYFYHNDKRFVDVDKVLAKYGADEAWKDSTLWPTSRSEGERLQTHLQKQQNPTDKKGIVGAFCRTFSIREVLKTYLSDVYTEEDGGRFTYKEGSTTNGLVIYDDMFAYSNHSTDPICGITCNAFDLMRLHRHGHLDDKVSENTPASKLPSFHMMSEFAHGLEAVNLDLIKSKLESDSLILNEFDDEDKKTDANKEWLNELQTSEHGDIKTTFFNAVTILRNDLQIRERMKYNQFACKQETKDGKTWEDAHTDDIGEYVGKKYNCDFSERKLERAIRRQAERNAYHPVQDYITKIKWDGESRIGSFFVDYIKCDDNAYTREAGTCWLVAAVARIFEPGYKFDHVPVISGIEGIGKSSFIAILGKGWTKDLNTFDNQKAMEQMQNGWLLELPELSALNRHEIEQQKAFISATQTTVRMAFGRHAKEFSRQCVFIGTSNELQYLRSRTGNRRWWPLVSTCNKENRIDIFKLKDNVDQIWAEAYAHYQLQVQTQLSKSAAEIAHLVQQSAQESDEWIGIIDEFLANQTDHYRYETSIQESVLEERNRVCVIEIWRDAFGQREQCSRINSKRISSILDNLKNWERKSTMRFGTRFGIQRGWSKVKLIT